MCYFYADIKLDFSQSCGWHREDPLLKTAKTKIDVVENLSLRVNGKPLQLRLRDYRITSRSFEVNMPSDNLLDLEEGNVTCLSDGYWLMFEPETKHLDSPLLAPVLQVKIR